MQDRAGPVSTSTNRTTLCRLLLRRLKRSRPRPQMARRLTVRPCFGASQYKSNVRTGINKLVQNVPDHEVEATVKKYFGLLFKFASGFCEDVRIKPGSTPLFLLATAGVRDLPSGTRGRLLACLEGYTDRSEFDVKAYGTIRNGRDTLWLGCSQ